MIKIPTFNDIEKILLDEKKIHSIEDKLAKKISRDYIGKEIYFVTILKGANFFATELLKKIDKDINIIQDYMMLSSYGNKFESSEKVKIVLDLGDSIKNKDVLVVEDIVDTGFTIRYLKKVLKSREPKSLKFCTMLNKPDKRKKELVDLKIDYVGMNIPNFFVVGYGLDYQQYCRNWPFIAVLKKEFYEN